MSIRWLLLVICGVGCLGIPWPLGTAAEPLPIEVREDKSPGSLRRWHLYERLDERPAVGEQVAIIGRFHLADKTISLASPPWLTVAFAKASMNGERPETFQAFAFACDDVAGLDALGFGKFTGKIVVNRPDLPTLTKYDQNIPVFRLEVTKAEPIRVARSPEKLLADAAADVQRIENRLRFLCAKYDLTYDFDAESLSWSWCEGHMACTSIVTRRPRFSFQPLPYATISVLYAPATGLPTRYVFLRRVWQDPRD